jgi:hypothetical protein
VLAGPRPAVATLQPAVPDEAVAAAWPLAAPDGPVPEEPAKAAWRLAAPDEPVPEEPALAARAARPPGPAAWTGRDPA